MCVRIDVCVHVYFKKVVGVKLESFGVKHLIGQPYISSGFVWCF